MASKNRKWLLGSLLALVVVPVAVVLADYLALFGVTESATTAFVEYRVRTQDAETGRPISDVKVTCFQYGTNNACGQPASRERGVIRLQLRMKKHTRESWLFTHKVWYSPVMEKELRIMYIHPDYKKPVQRFDITELMKQPNQMWTVEMEPLASANDSGTQQQSTADSGSTSSE